MAGINVSTYMKYLKIAAKDPMLYSEIANMPTTDEYDLVFANNYRILNDDELVRGFFTKTIPLVTYKGKGGKPTPVGKDSLNMEKLTPLDLKMITTIEAEEIKDFMMEQSMRNRALARLAGVYAEKVTDFNMIKQRMIISQCNELLGSGKVTFQYERNDGMISDEYQVDYTAIDGAINSTLTYSDASLHTWSSSSTTALMALADIEAMRKLGYDNSNNTLFKKNSDLVLFVGSTAFTYIQSFYNDEATDFVMGRDGLDFYFTLHGKKVPVVQANFTREYMAVTTTTGKYAATSENKLGAKEIMLVDRSQGNFGVADLRYLNLANLEALTPVPYNVTMEALKHDEGVEIQFTSRPIAHGRTKALIKGTVAA